MLIISKFALDVLLNEHILDRFSMRNKSDQWSLVLPDDSQVSLYIAARRAKYDHHDPIVIISHTERTEEKI
jgi:hypothetical protein